MIIDFLEIASFNSQRSFQLIWWIMATFLSNCKKVGIYLWGEKGLFGGGKLPKSGKVGSENNV